MNLSFLSKILNALLEMQPTSAVSIVFAIIFMWFSNKTIKSIQKQNSDSLDRIIKSHNDSLEILKNLIENGKFVKK